MDRAAKGVYPHGVPVAIGPFVGFAVGAALAWWWRREAPREDDRILRQRLLISALLGSLVVAPACAYFMVFAGDWSLFYLADSRTVPSALLLLVLVADAAAVPLGLYAGLHAARRHASRVVVGLAAAPMAIVIAILAAFVHPLRVDGTFQQVSAGFGTRPVAGGPLGAAVAWAWVMIGLGAILAGRAHVEGPAATTPGPRPAPARPRRYLDRAG